MSELRERPRRVAALSVALVALVAVSMLAGGALAGEGDCPDATSADVPSRTQR